MIRERKWRAFATLSFRREWVKVELRRRMRKNGAKTYDWISKILNLYKSYINKSIIEC